jgi:hypothetical protein
MNVNSKDTFEIVWLWRHLELPRASLWYVILFFCFLAEWWFETIMLDIDVFEKFIDELTPDLKTHDNAIQHRGASFLGFHYQEFKSSS